MIPGRMEAAITDHEKVWRAIEAGDAALAEALNWERIQHIRADVARALTFSVF